ncbi:Protein CBG26305 [Caenorhabditis briggsae]|uniref:Protein CBG26305 n=1 Tax=Caenorhabditis briggsae TaxID=6238 RepID=B6IG78_CAEBR|nr:Protein CBG26305 [Caenorhabditis briggsae]CAR98908.1 Protein CBG26305 [Caenorhabditis briggsae]
MTMEMRNLKLESDSWPTKVIFKQNCSIVLVYKTPKIIRV